MRPTNAGLCNLVGSTLSCNMTVEIWVTQVIHVLIMQIHIYSPQNIWRKKYYSNLKHKSICYVYIIDTVIIFTMCLHLWLQGLSGCERAKRDPQAGRFHAPQYLLRQFLR